jgi:hypothetical protein
VRFSRFNADYADQFQAYSGQRIFVRRDGNDFDVQFWVPGQDTPALVRGFGAVFTAVDDGSTATMAFFGGDGNLLGTYTVPAAASGLSFAGVSFPDARVASVHITPGHGLFGNADGCCGGADVTAMDDFIYGEPKAFPAYISFAAPVFSVTEGQTAWLPAVRTGNQGLSFSVGATLQDGTAHEGSDYGSSGPGFTSFLFQGTRDFVWPVTAVADGVDENDETFTVSLVPGDHRTQPGPTPTATVVIVDTGDQIAPRLRLLRAVSGKTASLRFTMSEAGTAQLKLARLLPGRRVGKACRAQTRANRRRARCTRSVAVPGTLAIAFHAGSNQWKLGRRFAGRRLVGGRYRATITASDAAKNRTKPTTVDFTLRG